jgi:hypothetical protein
LKRKKKHSDKPIKTWYTKWYADSITNTLFVWIYDDHINWRLDEDPPYTDTVKSELDQTIEEYRANGMPKFIIEMIPENNLVDAKLILQAVLNL